MENNSPYNFSKTYNSTPITAPEQKVIIREVKSRKALWITLAIIMAIFIFFVLYFVGRSVYTGSL